MIKVKNKLLIIPIINILITTSVYASPYKECDKFNTYMKNRVPNFYDTGIYNEQGINSYGFKGTCSEVCEANVMNLLFDTDFTEQDFVTLAVKLNKCTTNSGDKYLDGGQSAVQMTDVLNSMADITGYNIDVEYKVLKKSVPNASECAKILDSNTYIIMAVDGNILWNRTKEYCESKNIPYYTSNHWIVLKNPIYKNNKLTGFEIIDTSGSHISTINKDKLDTVVFGPTLTEIPKCACVIVKRLS